ncbi:MAG: YcjX family protein, partial [Planctomycetaceae bacterium]|nr:YcjX family protein [Planctomycetaceae bacterium]
IVTRLRESYGDFVLAARKVGIEFIQPAMTLIKWNEQHGEDGRMAAIPSPEELPFVPLPRSLTEQKALVEQMNAQYRDHVRNRVQPFLKRIQRCRTQLVLVDVLRILRNGVDAYNDTSQCIAEILRAYHDAWRPFRGIQQVLFAATKADHATKNYRANMTRLLDELVFKSKGHIKSGIPIASSEWFTSLRSTQEALMEDEKGPVEVLKGMLIGSSEQQAYSPGIVPSEWPEDEEWTFETPKFRFPEWQPRRMPKKDGSILPHMNLDKVIWKILEPCF